MLGLLIDLLMPTGRSSDKPIVVEPGASTIRVEFGVPGAFKRRLNESGWLADEVVAAGMLRQGKPQSLLSLLTGAALIDVARPRRSKSLPREFVLAVTRDSVVAFATGFWSEGDGTGDTTVVRIKRGERGSWPRELVRLIDPNEGVSARGGTLELAGAERIPVVSDGADSTDELLDLLGATG